MLKSLNELDKKLETRIARLSTSGRILECSMNLIKKYNIPIDISTDIFTLKKSFAENSEFVAFAILDVCFEDELNNYFTNEEISYFSKQKYIISKLSFPLEFNMVQIAENQWVGKTTVKELMEMRDAQIINYNENAQRNLTKKIVNGNSFYKITIDKSAVKKIRESFESNIYVPNTITLNMPIDTEYEFDAETNKLIVKEIKFFDIVDGYHRYVAMSQINDLNKDFDYNMELRIIAFDEDECKQFIYQEDQKTKMEKFVSESFNQYAPANRIVENINKKHDSLLQQQISINNGLIRKGTFAMIVNYIFVKGHKLTNIQIAELSQCLIDNINAIILQDKQLSEKSWSNKDMYLVLFAIFADKNDATHTYLKLKSLSIDDELFYDIPPRKKLMNQLLEGLR